MADRDLASALRARLARPALRITNALLIVAWLGLTITEIAAGDASSRWLRAMSVGLAILFSLELLVRFLAAPSASKFMREAWLDVVAVASIGVTVHPALRLLRLLRVVRLFAIARQLGTTRRQAARRALGLAVAIVLAALTATAALLAFEAKENPALSTFGQAFWFSLYSIFATQPTPDPPLTLGGKVVSLVLIFVGLSTFALFTGTVSAVVMQQLGTEGFMVDWEDLANHIIICGWNRKAEIIVREVDAAKKDDPTPVVVIAKLDHPPLIDPALRKRVQFLDDDFVKVSALKKAGIERASTCVLLSDTSKNRNERDADARTILAALTVEKINPKVFTCAELNRREYAQHLKIGNVDDYVVSGEHSAFLLAAAALHRGVMNVFHELLSYEYGNKFCRIAMRDEWVGRTFLDLFIELKKTENVTLVAVMDKTGRAHINPSEATLRADDALVAIAAHDFAAG